MFDSSSATTIVPCSMVTHRREETAING